MTTAVNGTTSATATDTSTKAGSPLGSLDSNAFLKLLVAQMKYQNPFSPSDPSAMLGQVAQYAQVEALQKLQAGQASSTTLEQARMAGEVIGKSVTGTSQTGSQLSGVVSSARFTPAGPVLVLTSGQEMNLTNVETIAAGPAAGAAATSVPAGTGTSSGSASSGGSSSGSSTSGSSSSGSGTPTASSSAATAAPVAAASGVSGVTTARTVIAALSSYAAGVTANRSAALSGLSA